MSMSGCILKLIFAARLDVCWFTASKYQMAIIMYTGQLGMRRVFLMVYTLELVFCTLYDGT